MLPCSLTYARHEFFLLGPLIDLISVCFINTLYFLYFRVILCIFQQADTSMQMIIIEILRSESSRYP